VSRLLRNEPGIEGVLASGLGAVRRWLGSVRPERRHLRNDAVANLPGAISSVPDGMAAAPAGVRNIRRKLAVSRRNEGVRRARALNLIPA
jgi:hypothetical protein